MDRPQTRPMSALAELATFTYHDVTDHPGDSGFQRPAAMPYKLSTAAFQRHLDAIGSAGSPRLVGSLDLARPGRHLLITFDDGGKSALEAAAEAGLGYLFTSEPWLRPRRVGGCWVLGRYCPKAGTPLERVGELARFRGWRSILLVRRLKGLARTGLPLLYRQYVRVRTRE